jgi:guanine nucleotide-binding protein subunit gamma
MPQYSSRDASDPSQVKKNKQSMADLKLRRLTELNNRLREDLERERIPKLPGGMFTATIDA